MLGILDIPAEVMYQIIQRLTRKDMKQCLLVNQKFYHCTINAFYDSLVIRTWNHDKFFEYHGRIQNAYDTSLSDKWSLVKRMQLRTRSDIETGYMFDCFINLVSIFSSLTFIYIQGNRNTLIQILKYMLLNLDAASLPHLRHLQIPQEEISGHSNAKLKNLYHFNVCYKFRQNLTHLSIENPYSAYCLESYQNNETQLSTLPFFKKLTNLWVYYESKMGPVEPLIDSTLFSACQSLTHFSLRMISKTFINFNRADFTCTPEKLKMIPRNIHSKSPSTSSSPNSNQSKPRNLMLDLREMDKSHMDAILNNILTPQLDKFLLIGLLEKETTEWIRDANLDDISRFLQHVRAAKRFKFIIKAIKSPASDATLKPITKLWRALTTRTKYHRNFPFKREIIVDFDTTSDPQRATRFTLKNGACVINLALDEERFFQYEWYRHLPLVPFGGDEAVALLSDNWDEMKFCVNDSHLHLKLNTLIGSYFNAKKLRIELKPYVSESIYSFPKPGCLVITKKTLASSVSSHSQEEDETKIRDRHYSFDEVSINSQLLLKLYIPDSFLYINFPFHVNTFALKNIPVMQNDDFHFRFNFKFDLPELVINFTSTLSLEECPIRLTVLDQEAIELDVLITTFLHDTPVAITNPGSTLDKIASKYTISSLRFKKVNLYYQSQLIPIKVYTSPKLLLN